MRHLLLGSAQLSTQWERRWSDIITTDLKVDRGPDWRYPDTPEPSLVLYWTLTEMLLLVVFSQAGLLVSGEVSWNGEINEIRHKERGVAWSKGQWRHWWSCYPRILSLTTCSVNISALLLHTTIAPRSMIMFVCLDHSSQLCKTLSRCFSW